MSAERAKRLEELFRLGVDVPPAERPAFLARHCQDDAELARELLDLLAQDDAGTKRYLASPVLSSWSRAEDTGPTPPERPAPAAGRRGDRIGRYRIVRQLGEGGMGVVYLAEQEEPVRREVALKIVKLGMDTRRVVARFENERQALALMDHPGIARIFDGGTTENGRPYFVMEYVEGVPLTDFCDQHGLDVSERLLLFVRVCEAVQHAHSKGVVHRDLKPGNVLVALRDGARTPKVIDFGIARATRPSSGSNGASRGGAADRPTRASEVIGTYAYMSPEQADPSNSAEVDARSDVYALGVMLYEILTGVLPHDADALAGKSPSEVSRLLADVDPPAPSTKITRLGSASLALASRRGGLDPRALARRTSGDLDWITLKAMERDPARRYASAYELALDVRRHLANQTVSAGPPSPGYRLRKFARRRRSALLAGAVIAMATASGAAGTALGLRRASAEARTAREQLASAQSRLETIQDMGGFMLEAFRLADPESGWFADESAVQRLTELRSQVSLVFREDPLGEARVRVLFGRMLRGRGELELARVDLERAVALQDENDAPLADRYQTGRELHRLSVDSGGYADYQAGLDHAAIGVEMLKASAPAAGAAAGTLLKSAQDLELDRVVSDLELLEKSLDGLAARDALLAADVVGLAGGFLGLHLAFPEGETLLERALAIREERLGATHPEVVLALADLVEHELRRGRIELARRAVETRLPAFELRFPGGHWMRAEVESMLGECLSLAGDAARAEELLESASRVLVAERGPSSRAAVHALCRLREHYERAGETLRAVDYEAAARSTLARSRDRRGAWTRTVEALGADAEVEGALRTLLEAAEGSAGGEGAEAAARALERFLREHGSSPAVARVVEEALSAIDAGRAESAFEPAVARAVADALGVARALATAPEAVCVEVQSPAPADRAREPEPAERPDAPEHVEGPSPDGADVAAPDGGSADPADEGASEVALETAPLAAPALAPPPAPVPAPEAEPAAPDELDLATLLADSWYAVLEEDGSFESYETAFLHSTQAVLLEPEIGIFAEVQALSLTRLGQVEEALWYLDRLDAAGKVGAVGWAVSALAYVELGQPDEAARALLTAHDLGKASPSLLPPDAEILFLEVLRRLQEG